jgi:hypothetical protein
MQTKRVGVLLIAVWSALVAACSLNPQPQPPLSFASDAGAAGPGGSTPGGSNGSGSGRGNAGDAATGGGQFISDDGGPRSAPEASLGSYDAGAPPSWDATLPDASFPDGGTGFDAGAVDGAAPESGAPDALVPDGGDSSPPLDAQGTDGSVGDADHDSSTED